MEGNSLLIRPYSDQHAIKTMAFVVEPERDISPDEFERLSVLEKKLKSELPRLVSHRAVTLNLGADGGATSNLHAGEGPGGFTLDRLMADGTPEWALSLQPNFVRVLCNKYERWEGTWKKAQYYFDEALPIVLEDNSIKAITLQYVDEFKIEGNVAEFRAEELFRTGSPYLTPVVFDAESLWHSHSGRFCTTEDGHRLLNVVNVSLVAQEDGVTAQIVMTHKIDAPTGGGLFSPDEDPRAGMDRLMCLLHENDKQILSEVITDKYIELIGLVVKK
jgi:uncharacterized protein (TIGR04255 family)